MTRAPGYDTIAATRARATETSPATELLRQVEVALSSVGVLEQHTGALSAFEVELPGTEAIAKATAWPALRDLAGVGPGPKDSLSVSLARRRMQLQLALDYLQPLAREAERLNHELHHLFEHQREALGTPEFAPLLHDLQRLEAARNGVWERRLQANAVRMHLLPTKEIVGIFADRLAEACADLDGNLHDGFVLAKALATAVNAVECIQLTCEDAGLTLPIPAPPVMGDDPSESKPGEIQAEVQRVLRGVGDLRRAVEAEINLTNTRIAQLDIELEAHDAALRVITG